MGKNQMIQPGTQKWKENPLVPTQRKILATEKEQLKFLRILDENKGFLTKSAKEFACSLRTVQRRMVENEQFATAVHAIKKNHDQVLQEELEEISYEHARKPSSVTQRIFLLNALDPARYRPKPVAPAPPQINISFGFDIPDYEKIARRQGGGPAPVEVEYEDVTPEPGGPEDQDKSAEVDSDLDMSAVEGLEL